MAPVYTISTEVHFCCSHSLTGYDGDCSRMHGHNWVLRAYYEFSGTDELGLTVDFLDLKSGMEKVIIPRFDHRNLNEVAPFDKVSPTSENIAAEIFRLLRDGLDIPDGKLVEVELWETRSDMVRYRE